MSCRLWGQNLGRTVSGLASTRLDGAVHASRYAMRRPTFLYWRSSFKEEFEMLFSTKAIVEGANTATAAKEMSGNGKIGPSEILRSTGKTADTGKIRLGGACRLPLKTSR